jgi:hypothetical protein
MAPHLRFPKWQSELQAAILETEPNKLRQRLDAAEQQFISAYRSCRTIRIDTRSGEPF